MCCSPVEAFPRPAVDLGECVREFAVHLLDRSLHRSGATIRDRKGDVEPALSLDERRDACLRLPTPRDHGVELPMTERLACPHFSQALGDGQSDVESASCLRRLLTLVLLAEHGCRHVDQPRVDPAIDGREGDFLVEETTDDLFRGLGRPQFLGDRPAGRLVKLRLGAAVGLPLHVAFLRTSRFVVGVPSDLPRDGRGMTPEPSRDGPNGHAEF